MPKSVFNQGLKIALESTRGTAPQYATNGDYYQGGKWIPITTDGLPTLADRQATIFPSGHAGLRTINNRAPVVGRRWSDGNAAFQITSDFLGVLLYAALGSLSSNRVDSTVPTLLADEPITGGAAKQLVLTNQPSDGGAVLEFRVSGTSGPGLISISGIDADGNGASEVIGFASAGSMYSRISFSSIGASGIEISGSHGGGNVTIGGVKYWEHIFSINNASTPTMAIQRHGDPTAGAASIIRMHTGMALQELTLNNPAEQRDGLFTGNVTWEGDPTATCVGASLNSVSAVKVWPAWTQAVTRDGANWYKVTNWSQTIRAGGRNYRAAAGVQNPQGTFWGGIEVTGSFGIQVDDEAEFLRWQGASRQSIVSTWNTPWKLTSSVNQQLVTSLTALYLEDVTTADSDEMYMLNANFRTIVDADNSVMKAKLVNNVPPTAYTI